LKISEKTKSLGALGLIRKCLTVTPAKRFTVDDIAAHWWVNLGYKYPPVHYYLTAAMRKNGVTMPSHVPALTYNERTKPTTITSQQAPKSVLAINSTPHWPMPSIVTSLLPIENGHVTDTQSNVNTNTNTHHKMGRSHRAHTQAITAAVTQHQTVNPSLISNQGNRRTSGERNQVGITSSSKNQPPARPMIY
jgi:hypothetical protein